MFKIEISDPCIGDMLQARTINIQADYVSSNFSEKGVIYGFYKRIDGVPKIVHTFQSSFDKYNYHIYLEKDI